MDTLHVLLEGDDDVQFFKKVLEARFPKYRIKTYAYATRSRKANKLYIEAVNRAGSDYIVFADLDSPNACFGKSKQSLKRKIPNADEKRTAIVRTEIESWYLAGIGHADAQKLGIKYQTSTDRVTKEEFDALMPARFESKADFMAEILKAFKVKTAKLQNESFRYVWNKFVFPGKARR